VAEPSSRAADGRDASASPPDRSAPDRRFPRSSRLTSRREYRAIYGDGVRVRRSSLTLFSRPNDLGRCRLGITATRKCGNAVQRNRIKRVLREIFRNHRARFETGVDIVVNARPGADFDDYARIEGEFLDALDKVVRRFRR
jgi:ribonuclease P protein component